MSPQAFWPSVLFNMEVVFRFPVKALLIVGAKLSKPIFSRPKQRLTPFVFLVLYQIRYKHGIDYFYPNDPNYELGGAG